jgi:hypothetical protein
MYEIKHFVKKLFSTFRILSRLFFARTFGTYIHSGWDGDIEYSKYRYRGLDWKIPTGPYDTV